jgi:hypothetical protein
MKWQSLAGVLEELLGDLKCSVISRHFALFSAWCCWPNVAASLALSDSLLLLSLLLLLACLHHGRKRYCGVRF